MILIDMLPSPAEAARARAMRSEPINRQAARILEHRPLPSGATLVCVLTPELALAPPQDG